MSHKEVGDLWKSDTHVTERGQDGQWKQCINYLLSLAEEGSREITETQRYMEQEFGQTHDCLRPERQGT